MELDKILQALVQLFNFCARYSYAVVLVTGFYLFAGSKALDVIGVTEIADDYRPVIGTLFTLGVALLLCRLGDCLWKMRLQHPPKREIVKWVTTLSEEEKRILRYYMVKDVRTNVLYICDHTVQSLVAKGFILGPNPLPVNDSIFPKCPYIMQDWAWKYFKHKDKWKTALKTGSIRTDVDSTF